MHKLFQRTEELTALKGLGAAPEDKKKNNIEEGVDRHWKKNVNIRKESLNFNSVLSVFLKEINVRKFLVSAVPTRL